MRLLAEALAVIWVAGGGYSLLRAAVMGRRRDDSEIHVRVNVTTTVRLDEANKSGRAAR